MRAVSATSTDTRRHPQPSPLPAYRARGPNSPGPLADLRLAAAIYDGPDAALRTAAAAARGFATGGEWMRLALATLRDGHPPTGKPPFARLGWTKYAAAVVGGSLAALAVVVGHAWPLAIIVGPLAFYAVEAQMAFLFPAALDGHRRPLAAAAGLTRRAGGTAAVIAGVLPIAAVMLLGGPLGLGFRRSWCVGCLAVCIWYERVRQRQFTPPPPRWELGTSAPLRVRHERVTLDGVGPARLLYASDLHLGRRWTAAVPGQLIDAVTASAPDVVLLGGDLVDVPAGLPLLADLVAALSADRPVYAVAGNHDARVGIDRVRRTVDRAGGRWLDGPTRIAGLTVSPDAGPADVLCGHDPAVFPAAAAAGARLVLAGHLHGGQCVLWTTPAGSQWPGCWANRWTALRHRRGAAVMLVSRGCGDTLPVRWNCPREVIVCDVGPAQPAGLIRIG